MMAKSWEVVNYLRPDGGTIITGEDYSGIEFVWAEPFTENEYQAAFAKVDETKAQKEANEIAKKDNTLAKLAALGLDADDLKVLGLG